jgi:hypothetical protein
MSSSGMLRLVAVVRPDVSEENNASIVRVKRIGELETLAVISNRHSPILVTLMMEQLLSSETSDLTRATRRNIQEDGILHSHFRENLQSYIALTLWTL